MAEFTETVTREVNCPYCHHSDVVKTARARAASNVTSASLCILFGAVLTLTGGLLALFLHENRWAFLGAGGVGVIVIGLALVGSCG